MESRIGETHAIVGEPTRPARSLVGFAGVLQGHALLRKAYDVFRCGYMYLYPRRFVVYPSLTVVHYCNSSV